MDIVMTSNAVDLKEKIEGHRLVGWSTVTHRRQTSVELELDNGYRVLLVSTNDCCAYTTAREVTQIIDNTVDHVITSVKVEGDHESWTIMADASELLKIGVDWDGSNGYYMYGFEIVVARG